MNLSTRTELRLEFGQPNEAGLHVFDLQVSLPNLRGRRAVVGMETDSLGDVTVVSVFGRFRVDEGR